MPKYAPLPLPIVQDPELRIVVDWLDNELRNIRTALDNPEIDIMRFTELHIAVDKPANGDTVYADGTDWNPGAGEGLYCREAGVWSKK
jgi:hypothetical protein